MSEVERTSAGLQIVIPGCERRTLPKSTTHVDEMGQGLLHFYKPPSLRDHDILIDRLQKRIGDPGVIRLSLTLNETKSAVTSVFGRKFLGEQLVSRADAPLRPSKGQKALPKSGLFGS